jgi:molybdate transport system permease protein
VIVEPTTGLAHSFEVARGPLLLSLQVATFATLLAALVGIAVAALLANYRFPGRDLVDVVFTAPIVMPPTVLGYYVLVVLGRNSALGQGFEATTAFVADHFHIGHRTSIVFTEVGAVIAAALGAMPLVLKSVRTALEDVDRNLIHAARTLGATPARAFFTIQLPLAKRGIAAALMLAFARSLGDFGVTLMVAGDIPDQTQTAALAIYDAIQAQRDQDAHVMIAVLTLTVTVVLYVVGKLTAKEHAT